MRPFPPIHEAFITLAQAGALGRRSASAVPELDAPPQFEQYVLVSPWPLVALLIAAGIVGFFVLNRLGKPARLSVGALALGVLLGVGIALAAALVTTTRERIMIQTRAFIDAAARADAATADPLLAPDFELRGLGNVKAMDRARLLSIIEKDMAARWAVKEHSISTLRSIADLPNTARSQVQVSVTPREFPYPMSSWWLLRWRMEPNGVWRMTSMEPQQIDGVSSPASVSY